MTLKSVQIAALLLMATILFSLASPLLKLMITEGGRFGLMHIEAISFCNVLFIGNLCAGLITLIAFPKRAMIHEFQQLNRKTSLLLAISCVLAVIYPSMVFFALEQTTVTRIVLISRFEGIMYALLMLMIFRQKISFASCISYLIIAAGVAFALFSDGMRLTIADLLLLGACVVYGFSEIISSLLLDKISLPTFIFARNFFSAIVFAIIVLNLFGLHHFAEAFYGDLWIAMILYALLVIVIGQFIWFRASKKASVDLITNFALITPVFTLFFSWALLGEKLGMTEIIAFAFIAAGLIIEKLVSSLRKPSLQVLGLESGLIGR